MNPGIVHGRRCGEHPTYAQELAELLRIIVVAGVPVGIVVIGGGSRFVMFLLRLTSPDDVIGLESDDGFTIGQFTLLNTYNLLNLGGALGIIGAAACVAVAPWMFGAPVVSAVHGMADRGRARGFDGDHPGWCGLPGARSDVVGGCPIHRAPVRCGVALMLAVDREATVDT